MPVVEDSRDFVKKNALQIVKWIALGLLTLFILMFLTNAVRSLFADTKEDVLREIRMTQDSIRALSREIAVLKNQSDSLKSKIEERGQTISKYEKNVLNVVVPKETNPDNGFMFLKTFAEKNK